MAMKSETIEAFIAEAEKELADVLRRKTELEDLIIKCKALFGRGPRQLSLSTNILAISKTSSAELTVKSLRSERGKKIWEQILDLIKEFGELSVIDIVHCFNEKGWPISKKNGSKIIYRALKDKEGKIFVHTDRRTWALKEQPV